LKKIKGIKIWTDEFEKVKSLVDDLSVMWEFYEAGEAKETDVEEAYNKALKALETLEFKNMLRNEEDKLGAILKITPGAGGTESQGFRGDE
jgi:peptide chain release factor 2